MLSKNISIMLPANGLEDKLKQGESENRKLNIKLGFDPTAPDLHLGHAVILRKLKEFQLDGHNIIIVIGNFTATIGDPTGKNASRKALRNDEVFKNTKTYIEQLGKILDLDKTIITYNADWLNKLNLTDIIGLMSKVTVAQLLQRNDFNKRYTEDLPIHMHELMYPILQGYDSLMINADIELGGTDQMFNCSMGRHMQELDNKSAQVIMLLPILRGLDGKEKMSKSLNNYIGLTDSANDIFGKVMSIPDHLIEEYLRLATDFDDSQIVSFLDSMEKGINPINIKKELAKRIVSMYYDDDTGSEAIQFFENQFQSKKNEDKTYQPITLNVSVGSEIRIIDLCHMIMENELSRTAIGKLIKSGAVTINSEKYIDTQMNITIVQGLKIKIGKRNYYEIN